MSIDEVEGLLKKDVLFSYHGPSDVSLLPSPNMTAERALITGDTPKRIIE